MPAGDLRTAKLEVTSSATTNGISTLYVRGDYVLNTAQREEGRLSSGETQLFAPKISPVGEMVPKLHMVWDCNLFFAILRGLDCYALVLYVVSTFIKKIMPKSSGITQYGEYPITPYLAYVG